MSTVIDKQVKAFGDAVMDAHREAMHYWTVQDLVFAGPMVANLINDLVDQRRATAALKDDEARELLQVCNDMLAAMTDGRGMIQEIQERGFEVKGVDDYLEAMLNVRQLLASLKESSGHSKPASRAETHEEFARAAQSMPPPQSWFEEDLKGLRGPEKK